jgi:hypothetical protein
MLRTHLKQPRGQRGVQGGAAQRQDPQALAPGRGAQQGGQAVDADRDAFQGAAGWHSGGGGGHTLRGRGKRSKQLPGDKAPTQQYPKPGVGEARGRQIM